MITELHVCGSYALLYNDEAKQWTVCMVKYGRAHAEYKALLISSEHNTSRTYLTKRNVLYIHAFAISLGILYVAQDRWK